MLSLFAGLKGPGLLKTTAAPQSCPKVIDERRPAFVQVSIYPLCHLSRRVLTGPRHHSGICTETQPNTAVSVPLCSSFSNDRCSSASPANVPRRQHMGA